MGELVAGALVLMCLLAVFGLVLGLKRFAVRLFGAVVVIGIGFSLLGGLDVPLIGGGGPANTSALAVETADEGGWDVTVNGAAWAKGHTVYLDGVPRAQLETTRGTVRVTPAPLGPNDYRPGAVRTFEVVSTDGQGRTETFTQSWCAPVLLLSARGTGENGGKVQFGHGVGSRGWRIWEQMAASMGVSRTVVSAHPVRYPADVLIQTPQGSLVGTYADSVRAGQQDLRETLQDVRRSCPDSVVVLIGYSQGAEVVGAMVEKEPTAGVRRAVLLADPRFDPSHGGQGVVRPDGAYLPGSGVRGGRGPWPDDRTELVRSWCWIGDWVCQGPAPGRSLHGPAYDCYERWAAYDAALDLVRKPPAGLSPTKVPQAPECIPNGVRGGGLPDPIA